MYRMGPALLRFARPLWIGIWHEEESNRKDRIKLFLRNFASLRENYENKYENENAEASVRPKGSYFKDKAVTQDMPISL